MNQWPPARVLTPAPWPPAQPIPPTPALVQVPTPAPVPVQAPVPVPVQAAPTEPVKKPAGSSAEMRKLAAPAPEDDSTLLYHPTRRPPVPHLWVLDDGSSSGELIRIRTFSFVIGRSEGDLTLPTDQLCSKRHAEIAYEKTADGTGQWVVSDLQSLHGTYFRHRRAPLANGTEFLAGGGRYRLELPAEASPTPEDMEVGDMASFTLGREAMAPVAPPVLREITIDRPERTYPLTSGEVWIGSDATCEIRREDDPFASPRHVRLIRDPRGVWYAENNKTANGLWIRLPRLALKGECAFQIGEQRFRLTMPE